MGLFSAIRNLFMSKFDTTKLENIFKVKIATSLSMQDLIADWQRIYQGCPSWVGDGTEQVRISLNTASTIVDDLATKCVSEITIGENDNELVNQFWNDEIKSEIRQQLEYGLSSGAFIIRPYYDAQLHRIALSWYTADRFIPVDWVGRHCMSGIFIDQDEVDNHGNKIYYTKLELQKWSYGSDGKGGKVEIIVKAFKSNSPTDLSKEIPLTEYEKWAEIPPYSDVNYLTAPLFVYAGMPFSNNKAFGSKAGVSLYKDAVGVLEKIDRIYDNLCWEIESTQHKIFVDLQMLETERTKDGNLRVKMDGKDKRLYSVLDANGAVNKYMDEYSPAIRQADITATLKTNLSLLCNNMHLDSGAYVYDEAKQAVTAREITSKEQKTYQTICDIQNWCITPAIERLFEAVSEMQTLYDLPNFGEYEIAVSFGDSILSDEETNRENAQRETQLGLRSKLNYLMEYRGLTEEEAKAELAIIEAEQPAQIDFFGNGME